MPQSQAESTWEINNYGRYIHQFPPIILKSIRQYEKINKKYVDKKCLLCSTKYISISISICLYTERLSVIWKSDLTDKIKRSFFQTVVVSILLYGCTTWTLTKCMEKKLDSKYTRILWGVLNKSSKQHTTKQQLYGHLPPITKVRWTNHAGHCLRSKDELISDILSSHRWSKVGRPVRTYLQQFCTDTGYSLEDLPDIMDDRDGRWERVRKICAGSATWWWWWWIRRVFANAPGDRGSIPGRVIPKTQKMVLDAVLLNA